MVNPLPIPVLDGGHIAILLALEGAARREFSVRLKDKTLLAASSC